MKEEEEAETLVERIMREVTGVSATHPSRCGGDAFCWAEYALALLPTFRLL